MLGSGLFNFYFEVFFFFVLVIYEQRDMQYVIIRVMGLELGVLGCIFDFRYLYI